MKIFLSYRRAEDNKSYIVGTIHEKLSQVFGKENVFRDTYDITSGTEWRARLDYEINHCKVMLVVIGPDWANLTYPDGGKRLFDEKDVTRWEVETGLKRLREENIAFIPVLVTGAKLPSKDELPLSLEELPEIQTITLRNFPDFDADIEKLVYDIRKLRGFREDDIKKIKEYEPKTIYIEEGFSWMGTPAGEGIPNYETPQHEVFLPAFRIGKFPVTNLEFEAYIQQNNIFVPKSLKWDGQNIRQREENHPVTGVTWFDALAYCRWLSEKTGREYTVPNEAQWEKACRGGNRTSYPWGDEYDPIRSNHGHSTLSSVSEYPEQNDYGLYDLVGNVRQWTCSLWGEKGDVPFELFSYPWRDDQRNNILANGQIRRVLRGSSYKSSLIQLQCSTRIGQLPNSANGYGFRVAMIV